MDIPASDTKHPKVPGVELDVLRVIFSTERNDFVDAPRAMRLTGMTIAEFDALMHAAAHSGYVRHVTGRNWWATGWQVGNRARRLLLDKKAARINRAQVDRIIAELPTRARTINADPERRRMIRRICLFGSALHDRPDYGDVDVFVETAQRSLSEKEWARLDALWEARAPESRKRGVMGIFAGNSTEHKDLLSFLKKGMKGLSIMQDDPEDLGTPYRVIYEADETGRENRESGQLVVPGGERRQPEFPELSTRVITAGPTYIQPSDLPGLNDPIDMTGVSWISTQCLWEIESEWPLPSDHRLAGMAALHGAQHLCPSWKGNKPGMQMLVEALAWADQNGAKAAGYPRNLRLEVEDRSRSAWLGNHDTGVHVTRVADRVDGYVYHLHDGASTTRADIAAHFAIAVALGKMLDETRLGGDAATSITIDLAGERRNRYEALPDLSKLARDIRKFTIEQLGSNRVRGKTRGKVRIVDAQFAWDKEDGQLSPSREGLVDISQDELCRFDEAVVSLGKAEEERRILLLERIPGLTSMTMRAVRPY